MYTLLMARAADPKRMEKSLEAINDVAFEATEDVSHQVLAALRSIKDLVKSGLGAKGAKGRSKRQAKSASRAHGAHTGLHANA